MTSKEYYKNRFSAVLAILCALVLTAAALTACSDKKEEKSSAETQAPAETTAPTEAETEKETEMPKLSYTDIDYDMPTTAPIEQPSLPSLSYANIDIDYEQFENKSYDAQVDENTGAITLDSSILFASDSFALSDSGKTQLKSFLDDYCAATLENSENKDKLKKIKVEGHTDTDGSYDYNKKLSENRAKAVMDYAVKEHPELEAYMYAVGCSYDNPVYGSDGTVDKEKSRRVVFIPETE